MLCGDGGCEPHFPLIEEERGKLSRSRETCGLKGRESFFGGGKTSSSSSDLDLIRASGVTCESLRRRGGEVLYDREGSICLYAAACRSTAGKEGEVDLSSDREEKRRKRSIDPERKKGRLS